MTSDGLYAFGRFRFDLRTGELWRDQVAAKLTPRAGAVLAMLIGGAQKVVTKQELFDQVWGGLAVGDDALTSCIQELRRTLGDDARHPSYIETRHRRGYRWMMPPSARVSVEPEPIKLVGRSSEMADLDGRLDQALSGRRQIVFVTGEAGIGKSALVSAFTARLDRHGVTIAEGQCLDHHGVGEPYLPLIEAVTRLGAGADGDRIKSILATHAPSWMPLMPSPWMRSEHSDRGTGGRATSARMLRELALAVETIAADTPLVLTLEDLHWSDVSTLDWLTHIARRPDPARLMVLATFRPEDAAATAVGLDSIAAELALHGRCHQIELNPLDLEAIESYLARRLGDGDSALKPREVAQVLLDRTGGNPLFMVGIVKHLALRPPATTTPGTITSIPQDLRRFLDRQIDMLDGADRDLLAAASVVRREFETAAVAAALGDEVAAVEAACGRLARQGVFIVRSGVGTWPDGTSSERYAFRHDLHRELLYERLPATRRALNHVRVGCRLEAAWSERLGVIAAELAEHFERANQPARAIPHHQRAAARAQRRSANHEAIIHLQNALDAIGQIADDDERTRLEVELRVGLGAASMAIRGFGAPEVLESYVRAETLCETLGERPDLFPALWGQWLFRAGRGEIGAASRLSARLLAMAARFGDAGLKIQAHHATWATSFVSGDLKNTRAHALSALALFDPEQHEAMASSYGNHDAACCARNFSAMALALADEGEAAWTMIDQALAAAKRLDDPFSLALTLYFTSAAAQMLGDLPLAAANAEFSVRLATEHGLAQPRAWSMGVAGWCLAEQGDADRGIAMTSEAISAMQAIQSRHFLSYLHGLLADALAKGGKPAEAMTAVEDGLALAEITGEHFYDAELHRLRGELLARPPYDRKGEAEGAFHAATKVARVQGAMLLERKAISSLRRWTA